MLPGGSTGVVAVWPGRGLETDFVPAYLETNAATSSASLPVTMFWGMIAPE